MQQIGIAGLVTLYLLIHYIDESAKGITFDDSPALAVAAWEHGVTPPPGFPAWSLLAGTFARIAPFGSVASRLITFSSGCIALACGIVSWCVLQLGMQRKASGDDRGPHTFRLGIKLTISAVAAGVLLGHSRALAYEAGRISPHSLTALCCAAGIAFAIKSSIACQWRWMPLLSAMCFGLGAGNDHRLFVAIPVFQLLWVAMDLRSGRDILGMTAAFAVFPIILSRMNNATLNMWVVTLSKPLMTLALTSLSGLMILGILTKGIGTRWRLGLTVVLSFLAPLILFALLPFRSFANPPLDWGFTRTWTGFFLHITRAQYAGIPPTLEIAAIGKRMFQSLMDLGPLALLALHPLLLPRRIESQRRRMVMGVCVGGFLHTAIATCFAIPPGTGQPWMEVSSAFIPSLLLLAVAVGVGTSMTASWVLGSSEGRKP